MARPGDTGPYSVDNVQIVLSTKNAAEGVKSHGPRSESVKQKIAATLRGVPHTEERRRHMSEAHIGRVYKKRGPYRKRQDASL